MLGHTPHTLCKYTYKHADTHMLVDTKALQHGHDTRTCRARQQCSIPHPPKPSYARGRWCCVCGMKGKKHRRRRSTNLLDLSFCNIRSILVSS